MLYCNMSQHDSVLFKYHFCDMTPWIIPTANNQLEQLGRLRSEDTPSGLMITHTIQSYWIQSQKKTVKVTN